MHPESARRNRARHVGKSEREASGKALTTTPAAAARPFRVCPRGRGSQVLRDKGKRQIVFQEDADRVVPIDHSTVRGGSLRQKHKTDPRF